MSEKPRPGQPVLAQFVKDEIARRFHSPKQFLTLKNFDKTSYYRVMKDSPVIGESSYRVLEGALDLPRYVLDYIAELDTDALERCGLDPDQLRVLLEQIHKLNPKKQPRLWRRKTNPRYGPVEAVVMYLARKKYGSLRKFYAATGITEERFIRVRAELIAVHHESQSTEVEEALDLPIGSLRALADGDHETLDELGLTQMQREVFDEVMIPSSHHSYDAEVESGHSKKQAS